MKIPTTKILNVFISEKFGTEFCIRIIICIYHYKDYNSCTSSARIIQNVKNRSLKVSKSLRKFLKKIEKIQNWVVYKNVLKITFQSMEGLLKFVS